MRCGHTVSASFIFLCHSEVWWGSFPVLLSPQASPPKSKSGSYCTIAFYQAVSCWLCTIAETVGLSPAATPGAPFIPVGKDAMTPWIFFSSQPHCIQDSPTSSFHLQKISLFPPRCKGHLSIFDLCWGDFTTPPSYYIGHLFEIFNHPRGHRGKNALSPPCIGIVALSPPPGAW